MPFARPKDGTGENSEKGQVFHSAAGRCSVVRAKVGCQIEVVNSAIFAGLFNTFVTFLFFDAISVMIWCVIVYGLEVVVLPR